MKTAKKIIALLLALTIIATAFSACAPESSNPALISSPEDFYGYKIAAQNGTVYMNELNELNKKDSDKGEIIIRGFETVEECFAELKLGRVDAVYCDSLTAIYYTSGSEKGYARVAWQSEKSENVGIALKKDSKLFGAINAAVDALLFNGTLKDISMTTLGKDVTINTVAADEPEIPAVSKKDLLQSGTLTVACDVSNPPMAYKFYQTKDDVTESENTGFDVRFAEELAKKLKIKKLNLVDLRLADIENAEFDCVISAGSIASLDTEKFTISKPYVTNAKCIVVNVGDTAEDQSGSSSEATSGSSTAQDTSTTTTSDTNTTGESSSTVSEAK